MHQTFYNAMAFNRPLVWDTSSVTNMKYTFYGADTYSQLLAWDTSSIPNPDFFDRFSRIGGWDGCAALTPSNPNCLGS